MSNKENLLLAARNALLTSASVGLIYVLVRNRARIIASAQKFLTDFRNPLRNKQIEVVDSLEQCQFVVNNIRKHCDAYHALGFDCEWITTNGKRRAVAMVQLSTHKGYCALFRLCFLQSVPKCLRDLLNDEQILKVGVGPHDDANKLACDYGVTVASTLDLRFLAIITSHQAEGLGKLAKTHLDVTLEKNWRISCSDWEAKQLTQTQLNYAADDALAAVKIFNKLCKALNRSAYWQFTSGNSAAIRELLDPFIDVRFQEGLFAQYKAHQTSAQQINTIRKKPPRYTGVRKKAFYDNCELEAPDGELLCTIDRKKANRYLAQNLGTVVKSEPFTVRLNFEPAGRAVGEVGVYYQTPKDNKCVVCGRTDAYIRKNVVPREYRKHFPDVMKTHTSHDILLLCPECHQRSNISDLRVREKLALICEAPLSNSNLTSKCLGVPELKLAKSAARAILNHNDKLPVKRREELLNILEEYFKTDNVNMEHLVTAANMDTAIDNENYCEHGEKVVQKYSNELGGLVALEKLWREHFLKSMHPKFLPKFWDINHNANRLQIRAQEGRIDETDMIKAGIKLKTNDTNEQNDDDDSNKS